MTALEAERLGRAILLHRQHWAGRPRPAGADAALEAWRWGVCRLEVRGPDASLMAQAIDALLGLPGLVPAAPIQVRLRWGTRQQYRLVRTGDTTGQSSATDSPDLSLITTEPGAFRAIGVEHPHPLLALGLTVVMQPPGDPGAGQASDFVLLLDPGCTTAPTAPDSQRVFRLIGSDESADREVVRQLERAIRDDLNDPARTEGADTLRRLLREATSSLAASQAVPQRRTPAPPQQDLARLETDLVPRLRRTLLNESALARQESLQRVSLELDFTSTSQLISQAIARAERDLATDRDVAEAAGEIREVLVSSCCVLALDITDSLARRLRQAWDDAGGTLQSEGLTMPDPADMALSPPNANPLELRGSAFERVRMGVVGFMTGTTLGALALSVVFPPAGAVLAASAMLGGLGAGGMLRDLRRARRAEALLQLRAGLGDVVRHIQMQTRHYIESVGLRFDQEMLAALDTLLAERRAAIAEPVRRVDGGSDIVRRMQALLSDPPAPPVNDPEWIS